MNLRAATETDIAVLVELLRVLFFIEADFQFDAEKQARGLQLLLGDSARACVLVAEEGGRVVGMVTGQIVISTAEGARSVWVEDLVVDEGCRCRGIAKALLAEMERWARTRGATRLQLLADLENAPALDFYRRRGWEETRLICHRRFL